MKPHGLDVILKEELLENGEVVASSENKNSLEAWIRIQNSRNGKCVELPMRSFVNNFINRLHLILTGDPAYTTRPMSVSYGYATTATAVAKYAGMRIGTGQTAPTLNDTNIETPASDASLAYSNTTFIAPYQVSTNPVTIGCEVRRLFNNNSPNSYYISEVGVMGKYASRPAVASGASTVLLTRDLTFDKNAGGEPINFVYDSDIRFDFKFRITHSSTGGLNLNFMRLIYNLFFKANINNANSKIKSISNGAFFTYTWASTTNASNGSIARIDGSAAQIYSGIIVGVENELYSSKDAPAITNIGADEYDFNFMSDEFTLSANTVSGVISGGNGIAQFSVSRTFTNNATTSKTLRRVGIIGKGAGAATAETSSQFLMAVNTPSNGTITVQPSQTYRVTYTFAIQV